jgi:hypothetical protein
MNAEPLNLEPQKPLNPPITFFLEIRFEFRYQTKQTAYAWVAE